jgi:hypothetical protein
MRRIAEICDVLKKMEVQCIICSPPLAFEAIYHFLCVFFLTILTLKWLQNKVDHFLYQIIVFYTMSCINMPLTYHKIIIMTNLPLN